MRESRTYGSVRAKAEWLSYSTTLRNGSHSLIARGAGDDFLPFCCPSGWQGVCCSTAQRAGSFRYSRAGRCSGLSAGIVELSMDK